MIINNNYNINNSENNKILFENRMMDIKAKRKKNLHLLNKAFKVKKAIIICIIIIIIAIIIAFDIFIGKLKYHYHERHHYYKFCKNHKSYVTEWKL